MDLSKMTRRDFHKSTALGVTSLALSAGPAVRNVIGANDRIGLGLIGAGTQGRFDFSAMMHTQQVDAIAIADVYQLPLAVTLDSIGAPPAKTVGYSDFRRILERKDIDAVIVATPEHWHGIPMIMACEAGKDVYVEKPISHTVLRGPQNGGGRQQAQPRGDMWHATALRRALPEGGGDDSRRQDRQGHLCRGMALWRRIYAREPEANSAARQRSARRDSIGISGSDPRLTIITIAAAGDSRAFGKPAAVKPPTGDRT